MAIQSYPFYCGMDTHAVVDGRRIAVLCLCELLQLDICQGEFSRDTFLHKLAIGIL